MLAGCASGGISTSGADFQNKFASGNVRLTCTLSCAGTVGAARQKLRGLYNNRLWNDLAKEVSSIGFDSDQQYYYLAMAAANLGYRNAARTYIALANASPGKCGGSVNVCDGFSFPNDLNSLSQALNNLDAKDAAAKEAAAKEAAARQQRQAQPVQPQNAAPSPQPKSNNVLGI